MCFYRGGQVVRKGVYWMVAGKEKIVLKDEGPLPGTDKVVYFRFSEICLLIIAVMFALGPSLVLPLQMESTIFIFLIGLSAVCYAIAFLLLRLIKRMSGSASTFGYDPTTVYMAGNKVRKMRRNWLAEEKRADSTRHVVPCEPGQDEKKATPTERGDKNVHS